MLPVRPPEDRDAEGPPVSLRVRAVPRGDPRPNPPPLRRGRCVRDAARGFGRRACRQAAGHESGHRQRRDLVKLYTRQANQARQAEITTEISEIVGGAEALDQVMKRKPDDMTTTETRAIGRIVKVDRAGGRRRVPPEELPEILNAIEVDFTSDRRAPDHRLPRWRSTWATTGSGPSPWRPPTGWCGGAEVREPGSPSRSPWETRPWGTSSTSGASPSTPRRLGQFGSAGRSTASPPTSTTCSRTSRCSRPGSRSSTCSPLPQGRQDRAVRRRRRGQDGAHPGDDQPGGHAARRRLGVRRGGGADP